MGVMSIAIGTVPLVVFGAGERNPELFCKLLSTQAIYFSQRKYFTILRWQRFNDLESVGEELLAKFVITGIITLRVTRLAVDNRIFQRHKPSRLCKEIDRRVSSNLIKPSTKMLGRGPFRQRTTDLDESLLCQIIRRRWIADFALDVGKNFGSELFGNNLQ